MKKISLFGLMYLIFMHLQAQSIFDLPVSNVVKKASVTENIGITEVAVQYNRISIKGKEKKIVGQLVNEGIFPSEFAIKNLLPLQTEVEKANISFSEDVLLEKKAIKAGNYTINIFLQEDEAKLFFSKINNNQNIDSIQVSTKIQKTESHVSYLKYEFMNQNDTSAVLALLWGKLKIPLKIEVDLPQSYIAFFRKELARRKNLSWQAWNIASDYCYQHNQNLREALSWADSAISSNSVGQENFQTLIVKTLILEKLGEKSKAETSLKLALKKGTAEDIHQYARFLQGQKRLKEAIRLFAHNKKKNSAHWLSGVGMMRVYSAEGHYKKALKYAKLARSRTSDKEKQNILDQKIVSLQEEKDINVEYVLGIDISRWQLEIDWEKVEKDSQNIKFVFMKATQGITLKDICFVDNWKNCSETNLKKSAYHFFKIGVDPVQQANFFIETVGRETKLDLPPVLDLEDEIKDSIINPKIIIEHVKIWLDIVEKAYGMKPIIYTAAYYWKRCLAETKEFSEYPLWGAAVAKEGAPSKRPDLPLFGGFKEWTIWQYSWVGKIQGIDTNVDMDRFNPNSKLPYLKEKSTFSWNKSFTNW